jgi:hypothetical protein
VTVPPVEYETALVYASMLWIERERGNADAIKTDKQQESLKSIELVIGAANAHPKSSRMRIISSARSSNGIIDDGSIRHSPLPKRR